MSKNINSIVPVPTLYLLCCPRVIQVPCLDLHTNKILYSAFHSKRYVEVPLETSFDKVVTS